MSHSLYGDDPVADIYIKQKNPCNTLRPELLCPLHTHTEYIKKVPHSIDMQKSKTNIETHFVNNNKNA